MKKIISLLLISIFIMTLAPVVFAEGEVVIVSPKDGSKVSSLEEILVSADSSVTEVILEFDGKIIEKKSESGEISFSASALDLYAGEHNITIYAVLSDGSLVSAKSTFTFTYDLKITGYSNNFNEGFKYGEDKKITEYPAGVNIAHSASGDKSSYALMAQGKDGTEDSAVELFLNGTATNGWGGPYIQFVTNTTNNKYPSYIVCTEFDLKMSANNIIFADEFKTSENGSYFFPEQKMFLNNSGKVQGTNFSYKAGEWMHIKLIMDFKTCKTALYIDDDYVTTVDKTVPLDGNMYVARLRLTAQGATAASDASYTIDNIDIYSYYSYSGIKSISAATEIGDKTDLVPVNSSAIKLLMNEKLKPESITAENVTLLVNGSPVNTTPQYDAESNVISLPLSEQLPYGAEIEAVLSDKIQFWDGRSVSLNAKAFLKTESSGCAFTGASFKSLGNKVVSKKQLVPGNDLSCDFQFTNDTEAPVPVLLIMTVSDGNRIIKVVPKTVSILPGSDTYSVSTTVPDAENLTLTAIACDSFTSLKAISDIITLK